MTSKIAISLMMMILESCLPFVLLFLFSSSSLAPSGSLLPTPLFLSLVLLVLPLSSYWILTSPFVTVVLCFVLLFSWSSALCPYDLPLSLLCSFCPLLPPSLLSSPHLTFLLRPSLFSFSPFCFPSSSFPLFPCWWSFWHVLTQDQYLSLLTLIFSSVSGFCK